MHDMHVNIDGLKWATTGKDVMTRCRTVHSGL